MDTEQLKAVIECSRALDMPHDEGEEILMRHGWDRSNRFDLPATVFVRQLQDKALGK